MVSWYRVFVAAIGFLCSLFSLLLAVSMIVLVVSPANAQTQHLVSSSSSIRDSL